MFTKIKALFSKIWCFNDLRTAYWDNTTPFVPPITKGKVIKVYDGDTITIASKMPYWNSPIYRFSVRLRNIDCPEIRSSCPDEKKCAQLAKKKVQEKISGKMVQLKNVGIEKYGRLLADIYYNDLCINNWLVGERLAIQYDGKKKRSPPSWMHYYLTGEIPNTVKYRKT